MARRKKPAKGAPSGPKHPRAIFTAEQVREIRKMREDGWTLPELREYVSELMGYQIGRCTIGAICRRQRYKDV